MWRTIFKDGLLELIAREAGFPAPVDLIVLGVVDLGPLRFLGGLCLGLVVAIMNAIRASRAA